MRAGVVRPRGRAPECVAPSFSQCFLPARASDALAGIKATQRARPVAPVFIEDDRTRTAPDTTCSIPAMPESFSPAISCELPSGALRHCQKTSYRDEPLLITCPMPSWLRRVETTTLKLSAAPSLRWLLVADSGTTRRKIVSLVISAALNAETDHGTKHSSTTLRVANSRSDGVDCV